MDHPSSDTRPPEHVGVQFYLNRPMMPTDRHRFEDLFVTPMLDHLVPGALVSGGGTYIADDGGPLAADFRLEIPGDALPHALEAVARALADHGTARGSYLRYGDHREPVGDDELVLLYTGAPWEESDDLTRLAASVRTDALRNGEIGWQEDAFADGDAHTVLVLSGPSSARILEAVRAELPRHPAFPGARLRSISPGAPESDPLT